jgi:hypothetical protein
MAEHLRSGRRPFEMHVGDRPPAEWTAREEQMRSSGRPSIEALAARQRGRIWVRPALSADSFPWESLGASPRFVGSETSSCVAALQPSIFHNHGADEFDRFLAGAATRGETALIVTAIGTTESEVVSRSILARFDDSISLPGGRGSIAGRRLPAGAQAELHPNARGADRDLVLRLRNRRSGGPWWAIELVTTEWEGSFGVEVHEPGGVMHPLLVNELGETLAGVWIPEGHDWRWYIVPAGAEWTDIVGWLVERALPEYVPDALRRARAAELVDDPLLTARELQARDALDQFERDAAAQREELEHERDETHTASDGVRFGLLYVSGQSLVAAVSQVLQSADFTVLDLDTAVGVGASADLLASRNGGHWLVEVKAVGGNVAENLVSDLDRHLQTWPALGRSEQLAGGVLVVNHQSKVPPLDRSTQPYTRQPFTASLRHGVIPTLALFAWWRDDEPDKVVEAVTGAPRCHSASLGDRPPRASKSASDEFSRVASTVRRSRPTPPSRWRHGPRRS